MTISDHLRDNTLNNKRIEKQESMDIITATKPHSTEAAILFFLVCVNVLSNKCGLDKLMPKPSLLRLTFRHAVRLSNPDSSECTRFLRASRAFRDTYLRDSPERYPCLPPS